MSGIGFGLTETNGAVSAISGHLFETKPHSSGPLSPLAEVRISDPAGRPCLSASPARSGFAA
jgi:long-subunit acyl-CoA synthetase (AMP-forming)